MDTKAGEGDPGPQIHRPIPRRPFSLNFTGATPPEEDSAPATPHISANDLRFLDPRYQQQKNGDPSADSSLSRATSLMNLTSSTLFGIYAPTTPGRDRPGFADERDDLATTPWGTGAETPAQPAGVDDETFRLMRHRSSSFGTAPEKAEAPPASRATAASWLAMRALLLFALGMGYGALVTRLPSHQNLAAFAGETGAAVAAGAATGGYDWRYLAFWGVAGVGLGSLLPWFDRVWEETFGRPERPRRSARLARAGTGLKEGGGARPEADWALVVRGIGAFVGIVFAIRKLPWASTMQASLTLALANPFLWYLIDRSKPGFLLSAAVGLAGSAVLMGLGPDVMPAPAALLARSPLLANGTEGAAQRTPEGAGLGWFASQGTVETGIWVLSVLFCSCVCFGNIGRRLALNGPAAARGRWGGER